MSVALLALAACDGDPSALGVPSQVSFNRDVRQILSDKCYACHGPDAEERQAELRLDERDSALREREGRFAIVPGNADASELVRRIHSLDDDERMPPPDSRRQLTPREIGILTRWVEQGARYEPHWAFIPPRPSEPPDVDDEAWIENPIDRFILEPLERTGLAPVGDADAVTLLRRLSFDLLGLPPTLADVEAHVAGQPGYGYEELVERWLSSPRFGERMASHWLDLVRYADTNGYNGDQHRYISPYRDYVIASFNDNVPFDRFTIEQIAGDLLPDPNPRQRVATGYNRLNQVTTEVGAVKAEYVAKYAADRVRTTASVWLGATLGCAECHDHKFDPFSAKDFYSFGAFFADVEEQPVYSVNSLSLEPEMVVSTSSEAADRARMDRAIARLESEIDALAKADPEALAESRRSWEKALLARRSGGQLADPPIVSVPPLQRWSAIGMQRMRDGQGPVVLRLATTGVAGVEQRVTLPQSANFGVSLEVSRFQFGKAFSSFVWMLTAPDTDETLLHVRLKKDLAGRATLRVSAGADASLSSVLGTSRTLKSLRLLAHWSERDRAWKVGFGVNGAPLGTTELVVAPSGRHGWPTEAQAKFQIRMGARPGTFEAELGRFAFVPYLPDLDDIPEDLVKLVALAPEARSPLQRQRIELAYRTVAPAFERQNDEIAAIHIERRELQEGRARTLITRAVPRRETRVLPRGDWSNLSGEIVSPAIPAVFGTLPGESPQSRLALARWLVSGEQPLTARVVVNRLWKLFFGHGIARTLDDFGTQGARPTHPELLDWLALEFVESGWDLKHMIRLMLTSHSYRLSSSASPEWSARDPLNERFARQSRYRLDAEMIRDNALSISGLLSTRIGGPSVQPYQPEGYWANVWTFLDRDTPASKWEPSPGTDQYRRGLYTYWKRSFPHPSLLAFDAPSREECTAQRAHSNTPIQALTLLNDPTYVEAARVFAERIVREGGADEAARIDWAYRETLSKPPPESVREILGGVVREGRAAYERDPDAAQALLEVGQYPAPADLDTVELGAWTSLARVLLNLYETTVRN